MINKDKKIIFLHVIKTAGASIEKYFGYGRFETLEKSMREICEKIGEKYTGLPHVNKTQRGKYREYYTNETKNIIAEKFKKEIELFDYKF